MKQDDADRQSAVDVKFSDIAVQMADLKREMALNTTVTAQVRDILTSFAVLGKVAKWCTAVGAFGLMLWHAWQKATGR